MRTTPRAALLAVWLDTVAVLAPTECSGCGQPDRALCGRCRSALTGSPHSFSIGEPSLDVWSALDYAGPIRRVLLAYKDGGRTDAVGPLAHALSRSISASLDELPAGIGPLELVTVPSTRAALRRRGYRPVELLLHKAGLRPAHVLRAVRQTEDQAALGQGGRQANRADSLVARRDLGGRHFLIVDDIVTTGATILEARRAIEAARGRVVAAASVAHTRRLFSRASSGGTDDFLDNPHYGG